jgi:endogenous inhibitor of DNA gyrase (YacG/DUF329 family)
MSDDFDREAERERLREKYEQDKQKREATEEMSELLLQGATMTNRHCPECHSPVFRYDGTEFCPTCQREVTEDGEFADGADEAGSGAAANGETAEATQQPADEGGGPAGRQTDPAPEEAAGSEPATGAGGASTGQEPSADTPAGERAGADRSGADEQRPPAPSRDRRPARVDPPARREESAPEESARSERSPADAGDLGEAEAALVREITALTRQAEQTRDVGRKRDLFAAAREAAETLQTIRRL